MRARVAASIAATLPWIRGVALRAAPARCAGGRVDAPVGEVAAVDGVAPAAGAGAACRTGACLVPQPPASTPTTTLSASTRLTPAAPFGIAATAARAIAPSSRPVALRRR